MKFSFFVEIHALVDSIRQIFETEVNDLKHIIQLFDNTDPNEHMAEIVRLRKKIDELTANKVSYSDRNLSSQINLRLLAISNFNNFIDN
jgi:hypothetical protein